MRTMSVYLKESLNETKSVRVPLKDSEELLLKSIGRLTLALESAKEHDKSLYIVLKPQLTSLKSVLDKLNKATKNIK